MTFTIAAMSPADVEEVAALERVCFGPDAWSAGVVAEELAAPDRSAWAARREVDLVGYLVLRDPGADDPVDVQRIAVDPARRREGIARALLATAEPLLAGRTVLLEVAADNTAALSLYAGLGFTEIARRPRYYADGRPALVLTRQKLSAGSP